MAVERGDDAVFVDEEVTTAVLGIVRDAKRYAVVVTPYLKLWTHAKQALELALQRGTEVTFVIRQEVDVVTGAADDVNWLLGNGVKILTVPYLHAKIYLNESATIVSSMNIHRSSSENNLEFALRLRDGNDQKQIRD